MHIDLYRRPVALAAVAWRTGGHDVLPNACAPAAAWQDVVDGEMRGPAAVLAGPRVPGEHGTAGDLSPARVAWDPDVCDQSDHDRVRKGHALRVQKAAPSLYQLRFLLQDEHDCPPHRTDVQGLIGSVEDEHSARVSLPAAPGLSFLACLFARRRGRPGWPRYRVVTPLTWTLHLDRLYRCRRPHRSEKSVARGLMWVSGASRLRKRRLTRTQHRR
jgi:hypothetical protein